MANLRRRSSRLSKNSPNPSSARKTTIAHARLDSLVERDETPDPVHQSIDGVLSTPARSRTAEVQLSQLCRIKTPQSQPRPDEAEMNPKTAHRSTAKAPDSGLRLGFADIQQDSKHNTPSKSAARQSVPATSAFEFKFSSDVHLTEGAQALMQNIREDAARIKSQMLAEKAAQEEKEQEADNMFGAGRKIAKPRGKAGRFSDIHMAQFKQMDSIENHASSFRARPGFAAPTAQSLKRSPSKAELDERPRTAGKNVPNQPRHVPPPVTRRPDSVSPFKSIPVNASRGTSGPPKRQRQAEHYDVSDSRPASAIPTLKSSNLYSPTKSSLARSSQSAQSTQKSSMIPRSNSTKHIKDVKSEQSSDPSNMAAHPPLQPSVSKPLPPLPVEEQLSMYPILPQSPSRSLSALAKANNSPSRLPTLSGLKSILKGGRRTETALEHPATPKNSGTTTVDISSTRKVDFTPSVKSRHAVKLAVDSPSPAKIRRDTPYKSREPIIPYDSSAWIIEDDGDAGWDDEESDIAYPNLPLTEKPVPYTQDFPAKAKEHTRRESTEFKSIFTDLRPARTGTSTTLTSINTTVNRTNPEMHANKVTRSPSSLRTKPLPATIRQVPFTAVAEPVQPFEDTINTVPHGLPGKRRRRESINKNTAFSANDDAKENQLIADMPSIPGGWNESIDEVDNEASTRAGKRVRTMPLQDRAADEKVVKKPSAAREAAAKNAKDRKSRGVLSLSRLNMLSRPKTRG